MHGRRTVDASCGRGRGATQHAARGGQQPLLVLQDAVAAAQHGEAVRAPRAAVGPRVERVRDAASDPSPEPGRESRMAAQQRQRPPDLILTWFAGGVSKPHVRP